MKETETFLVKLKETDSTNDQCRRFLTGGAGICHVPGPLAASADELLSKGALAVSAESQTAGRGRQGRSFLSVPEKGLYLSFAFRPSCSLEEIPTITCRAGCAALRALDTLYSGSCRSEMPGLSLKWPNDLLLNGRKLGGILCEYLPEEGAVIVGLGINLALSERDLGELAGTAISLKDAVYLISGASSSDSLKILRDKLEGLLLEELEKLAGDLVTYRGDLEFFRRRCSTLGRDVSISHVKEPLTGIAESVGDDFSLQLRLEDGSLRAVSFGEVEEAHK